MKTKPAPKMREIENTGDQPMCPDCFCVCVPTRGASGPGVGTYVVVKCVACRVEFKVGPKKIVLERNERP